MCNLCKGTALFIGGALVGAAAALLFTTEKGKEMRDQMAELANEAAERAQNYCEQVKKNWEDAKETVSEKAPKEA